MEYQIVSNVADKTSLFIDNDMTVGEVRAVIQVMVDAPPEEELTLTFNGKQLFHDEEIWADVLRRQPQTVSASGSKTTKLFVNVTGRQRVESSGAQAVRSALLDEKNAAARERLERERARMMEPQIEAMANNPAFFDTMVSAVPQLRQLMKDNPAQMQEMRNPEMIKMMLMSQLDPDRRREMNRSLELSLAQISSIPGGQQMLDRHLHGLLRDQDTSSGRTAADLTAATEDHSTPDPNKQVNSDVLPNPWQQQQQQQQQQMFSWPVPNAPFMPAGGAWNSPYPMGRMPGSVGNPNRIPGLLPGLLSPPSGANPAGAPLNYGLSQRGVTAAPEIPSRQTDAKPSSASSQNREEPAAGAGGATGSSGKEKLMDAQAGASAQSYAAQLHVLQDMGFTDDALCLEALRSTCGDVDGAVDYIAEHQQD